MSDLSSPRPPRMRLFVYVPTVVLLYVGNLILGVWLLFRGLLLPTPYVAFSSILDWIGAWYLCYLAYRRSHTFGYVLLASTVALTVLILVAVFFLALFFGALGDA